MGPVLSLLLHLLHFFSLIVLWDGAIKRGFFNLDRKTKHFSLILLKQLAGLGTLPLSLGA